MVERKAMKILIMCLCLFFTSSAAAWDGELYFGKYLNSTLRSKPGGEQTDYAEWLGGVEIGHKLFKNRFRPRFRLETLMDGTNGDNTFSPASIKFDFGARVELYRGLYIDASHMCWHPIDSGGDVEQYNLIKLGVRF